MCIVIVHHLHLRKHKEVSSSTRHVSIHVSSIRGLVTNQDVILLVGWNFVPQNFDFITEEILSLLNFTVKSEGTCVIRIKQII
jgi:hypothetical protein